MNVDYVFDELLPELQPFWAALSEEDREPFTWMDSETRNKQLLLTLELQNRKSSIEPTYNSEQKKKNKFSKSARSVNKCSYPFDLCRMSPFIPGRIPKNRMELRVERTHETPWGKITISGPQVYTGDEDVLLTVLALAPDGIYRGSIYKIAKERWGRAAQATEYQSLRASLKALLDTTIEIETKHKTVAAFHILDSYEIDAAFSEVTIKMNSYFKDMCLAKLVTKIEIDKRMMLTEAGKAIERFLASHRSKSWWGQQDKLLAATNIGSNQPRFRKVEQLKRTINEMKAMGRLSAKSAITEENVKLFLIEKSP